MRDCIGNKVSDNDYIRWNIPDALRSKLVFRVVRILESNMPPIIQLSIALPIVAKDNEEPVLEDFLCARDPQSDALVDQLMKGARQ